MTTLRVIIDEMLDTPPRGAARSAEELTGALIATAPRACFVEGIVSASTEQEYASIRERLPGLAGLHKNSLARRELTLAWAHGFTRLPGLGMIHAPSLFAPLSRHDRLNNPGQQIVVTINNAFAWTHPESLGSRISPWVLLMAKRAKRHADAIVVPTHATASRLAEFIDFGDRVRVIGGAPSNQLIVPADHQHRAVVLGLPDRYILAFGDLTPRRALRKLIAALPSLPGIRLVIIGPSTTEELAHASVDAGVETSRIIGFPFLSNEDVAVVIDRAAALVIPSMEDGFSLPMLEAFRLGTPVVHSDDPALVEVSGGAGAVVPLDNVETYPARLAEALRGLLGDSTLAERLSISGQDRARLYSWSTSAEKVWQLHADL